MFAPLRGYVTIAVLSFGCVVGRVTLCRAVVTRLRAGARLSFVRPPLIGRCYLPPAVSTSMLLPPPREGGGVSGGGVSVWAPLAVGWGGLYVSLRFLVSSPSSSSSPASYSSLPPSLPLHLFEKTKTF